MHCLVVRRVGWNFFPGVILYPVRLFLKLLVLGSFIFIFTFKMAFTNKGKAYTRRQKSKVFTEFRKGNRYELPRRLRKVLQIR